MSPIAIIGASSMVGSRFCELADKSFELIKTDLNGQISVDITDKKNVENFFAEQNFEYVILFSAFTDVDAAEIQRNDKNESCWRINVIGSENIVNVASKHKKKLIILSTDFVFDGSSGPYDEDDLYGPDLEKVSWYGQTKIESEKKVKTLTDSIILRISYPYRAKFPLKEDFARSILRKYEEKNLYPMFSDQTITPTFADDVFSAIEILISKRQKGIFHLGSPINTTPFDFARELINTSKGNPDKIEEGSLAELLKKPGSIPRPLKGGMKVEKMTNLGFKPTDYKLGIKELFAQMQDH